MEAQGGTCLFCSPSLRSVVTGAGSSKTNRVSPRRGRRFSSPAHALHIGVDSDALCGLMGTHRTFIFFSGVPARGEKQAAELVTDPIQSDLTL